MKGGRTGRAGFSAMGAALILAGCNANPTASLGPAQQALAFINEERAGAGCEPLAEQVQLMAAASGYAHDMAEGNFYGHVGPDGSTLTSRVQAQGYRGGFLGENIAAGQTSARQVVNDWMHSPGHRGNILNCQFNVTGIAMVRQGNDQPIMGNPVPFYTYWVHDFGRE